MRQGETGETEGKTQRIDEEIGREEGEIKLNETARDRETQCL